MGTLTEQRQAAVDSARAIIERAKSDGRDLTDDETKDVQQRIVEAKDFDAKMRAADQHQELLKTLGALGSDNGNGGGSVVSTRATNLGEHVVKHIGDALASKRGSRFSLGAPEWKAATDVQATTGLTFPQIDQTVVQGVRQRPTIAGLLGSGTMASQALTYYIEGVRDGNFAAVAELGAKPQIHYNYTTQTDALSKVAGFTKVSDEMTDDLTFLVSEINSRVLYDLSIAEEVQLLNGNGTSPNLRGILQRSGIQTEDAADAADNVDAVFRAMTKVQTGADLAADGVVIHPLDYQTFRLGRDDNGQYLGGGPFTGAYGNAGGVPLQPPLWGLRTVVTTAIEQGTALVAAFAQAGTVYRKGGVRVESTNSNEDDFTHNRITIRAEERLALAVRRPSAFVAVTLL